MPVDGRCPWARSNLARVTQRAGPHGHRGCLPSTRASRAEVGRRRDPNTRRVRDRGLGTGRTAPLNVVRGGPNRKSRHEKGPLERVQRALGSPGDHLLSRISTIIGGCCLTTVFGMGTGVASYLWSPGILEPELAGRERV